MSFPGEKDLLSWGFVKEFDNEDDAKMYVVERQSAFTGKFKEFDIRPEGGRFRVYVREKQKSGIL